MRYLSFSVSEQDEGKRADAILRQNGISTAAIRRAKRRPRGILVNGEEVYTAYPVHAGQIVSLLADDRVPSEIVPNDGPVDICYEDDDILVINKPPHLAVHPCAGSWEDSLGARLIYYYRTIGLSAEFHPIHRLDKGTSGLMTVAKHPSAQHILTRDMHTAYFHREYLAVCEGRPFPPSGSVNAPLGHSDRSYIRQEVRSDGKPAVTHYETVRTGEHFSLVRLVLETGRTHQIRVHMAQLGCPLVGDFLYGNENPALIDRPALHSCRLVLRQPFSKVRLCFDCPLPEDMAKLLR